jgi:hypothetical protein
MANKKNKLQNLDQVDGKVAGGSHFRTLDALIGESSSSPYKQSSEHAYEEYVNTLNSTDLHRHAEKVGLVPSVERRVLKERLMKEFRKFIASRSLIPESLAKNHMTNDCSASELSSSARRILREGA